MTLWHTSRSPWGVAVLVLAALQLGTTVLATTPEASRDSMPLRIQQSPEGLAGVQPEFVPKGGWPPLWLDARAIELMPDGKLDLDQPSPLGPTTTWRALFDSHRPGQYGPQGAIRVEREAQEARGCHPVGELYSQEVQPPDRSSLARTAEIAETAVLGRVIGRSYGFYRGVPGQLIKLVPARTVGLSSRAKRDAFFFFMPVGEFQVGSERICKTDNRYAIPPGIGEEVFVFTRPPAGENHDVLDVHDAREVVPVRTDGTLALPGQSAGHSEARAKLMAPGLSTKAQLLNLVEKRADR